MTIQRQAQRRAILSMIGVTPWVGRETPTLSVQDIHASGYGDEPKSRVQQVAAINSPVSREKSDFAQSDTYADATISRPVDVATVEVSAGQSYHATPESHTPESPVVVESESALRASEVSLAPDESETNHQSHQNQPSRRIHSDEFADESEVQTPIAPFTLQGISYNNWVMLVDLAKLTPQAQKLWQNMHYGLSVQPDHLAFPFCKSMSTLDMANASLAGFVFKLGNSEQVQVTALTDLAEGLDHERMVRTPLLEEMLAEPSLKRQLWQLLSQPS